VNSVVMSGVTISDYCTVQSTVVGHGTSLGSKVQLRECHVGPGCVVPDNADLRSETLTGGKRS